MMNALPTKDDIVERITKAYAIKRKCGCLYERANCEYCNLDVKTLIQYFTTEDLLALLKERGCDPRLHMNLETATCWVLRIPKERPDE